MGAAQALTNTIPAVRDATRLTRRLLSVKGVPALREHGGGAEDFPICQSSWKVVAITEQSRIRSPDVWWRLSAFVVVVVTAFIVALTVDLPSAAALRRMIEETGWAAPAVFVGLYAVVTLAPVPKNVLSALGGLLFGLLPGVLLVLAAALVGASVAFALGRGLGRDSVERLTSTRVHEVDALLARRGLVAVVAVRLVPVVPFTAINYAAGLTGVRTRDYLLGTAVGIVPGTVAYVTLGTYGSTPGAWPFLASAAALVALSVGGVLVARRRRRPRESDGTA